MMELAARFGEDAAVLAYRACVEGVGQLLSKAADLRNVGSARVASVQYASRRGHVGPLRAEYELRARHGFAVDWLDPAAVRASCGFNAPGAIRSRVAARLDPYRTPYRLLARLRRRGPSVFDRPTIHRQHPPLPGLPPRTPPPFRLEPGP